MQTIYKYELRCEDSFCLDMPQGAQVLSVQVQKGTPFVWALVDRDRAMAPKRFAIRGTGHPCDELEASQYVGTFQLEGGALVFHLFQETAL